MRFFLNVTSLRRAGVLALISPQKLGEQDPEYRKFAGQTNFDYTRDLDAVAGAIDGDRKAYVLRGRFDRRSLWTYANTAGGRCQRDVCQVPTEPGRRAEFKFVQPDVLAISVDQHVSSPSKLPPEMPSPDPVWIEISPKLLADPADLPLPLQILAVSVQSARPVILAMNRSDSNERGYLLKLQAIFPNAAAANTSRNQLELETKALSLALAKQHGAPDPRDLTGLLASGTFKTIDNELFGRWVVKPELVSLLQ